MFNIIPVTIRTTYLKLLTLLCMVMVFGCECGSPVTRDWSSYQIPSPYEGKKPDPYKQLIVWLKPGTTRQEFNKWLQDSIVKKENNELKIRFVCGSCDSTLFLMEGKGVELYMQGEVANGGSSSKKKPKVTGESEAVYYSTNVPVRFPGAVAPVKPARFPGKPSFSEPGVKVAVFDTGLDTALVDASYLYNAADSACISGGSAGWNFVAGTNNWADDNAGRHGSMVTKLITDETEKYRKNSVSILPVKIFDADGTSDLYSTLCGFAYASNRKVDIINASFGYYESRYRFDSSGEETAGLSSPLLLRAFIEEYLTKHNIILVAAAGNKDDAAEDPEYNPVDPLQKRNLDSVHFYPASLAPVLPGVIAVTTVYKDMVSPTQNYSGNIVDVGVQADGVDNNDHFYFINPVDPGSSPVSGSSFAAPVATGKLAAWYHTYKHLLVSPSPAGVKDSIFNILESRPFPSFLYHQPSLADRVKDGKWIDKGRTAGFK
ncbi:MAG: S8 family serine peptidase [Chitinophagaceae bacterium]|nr:S8 family serine peptidase [Chitinophagaceae bacterium]